MTVKPENKGAHFKNELHRNGWRVDHDNLRMKFSALNVDFICLNFDLLNSWRPPYGSVKYGYPFKMSDFC